jgi:hypothetical protein
MWKREKKKKMQLLFLSIDSIELRLVSEMAAAGFESVPTFTGKAPDSFGGVYECSEA